MMIFNQSPDTKVNKAYVTLISGLLVTAILGSGNERIAIDCNSNDLSQIIYYNDEKTNIYKSFTNDYCISMEVDGYSNNKSNDLGIDRVIISEDKLENLKKLDAIALLKDNWNGNGAKAFRPELISKARNIITFLDIQPEVFPTACESLQLEYDKEDGAHLEIELTDGKKAEIFQIDSIGREHLVNVCASIETIAKVVDEFYG